jgi:hypothetical protein
MKRLLILLFITLGVVVTPQAQGVVDVQEEGTFVRSKQLQSLDVQTLENVIANMEVEHTKVVTFTYAKTPELNRIVVTTSDTLYAEVLAVTYDLKRHTINEKGKHTFEFGNRVREARIYTNLVSANGNNFWTHRVRYLS